MFIAEKGPECFAAKKDAIQSCLNSTFIGYIPTTTMTLANIPRFILGENECKDLNSLEYCIAKELSQCAETTPLNLVESLFKYVRTESPCANFTSDPEKKIKTVKVEPNHGQINRFCMQTMLGAFLIAMMYKFTNIF